MYGYWVAVGADYATGMAILQLRRKRGYVNIFSSRTAKCQNVVKAPMSPFAARLFNSKRPADRIVSWGYRARPDRKMAMVGFQVVIVMKPEAQHSCSLPFVRKPIQVVGS